MEKMYSNHVAIRMLSFKTQEIKGNKLLLAPKDCKMMVLSCVKNIYSRTHIYQAIVSDLYSTKKVQYFPFVIYTTSSYTKE